MGLNCWRADCHLQCCLLASQGSRAIVLQILLAVKVRLHLQASELHAEQSLACWQQLKREATSACKCALQGLPL